MNYELTENMVEYRSEHERLLYNLGLAGSGFKKVYYDPNLGRQVAVFVPAEDVIVPYGASHIETAERVTHVMRKTKNELKKLQASGFYVDVDLGEPQAYHSDIEERKAEEGGYSLTNDDRYSIYEVHADIIIDGVDNSDEGIAKPYIVSIERGSYKVLAIRRNWNPDDRFNVEKTALCALCIYPRLWVLWSWADTYYRWLCTGRDIYHTSACRCRYFGKPPRRVKSQEDYVLRGTIRP